MTPTEDLGKYVTKDNKEGRVIACYHGRPNELDWIYLVVFLERKLMDNELSRHRFDSWLRDNEGQLTYDQSMVDAYIGNPYTWLYENELFFITADIPLDEILTNLEKEILCQNLEEKEAQ